MTAARGPRPRPRVPTMSWRSFARTSRPYMPLMTRSRMTEWGLSTRSGWSQQFVFGLNSLETRRLERRPAPPGAGRSRLRGAVCASYVLQNGIGHLIEPHNLMAETGLDDGTVAFRKPPGTESSDLVTMVRLWPSMSARGSFAAVCTPCRSSRCPGRGRDSRSAADWNRTSTRGPMGCVRGRDQDARRRRPGRSAAAKDGVTSARRTPGRISMPSAADNLNRESS